MAALNDDVYARVREKVKEHNLTEQEIKVVDTARDQLSTHSKKKTELMYSSCQLNTFYSNNGRYSGSCNCFSIS